MIISHVIGGLGNQMFQYATGRSLAMKLDTELRLDISDFVDYDLHQGFELCRIFNMDVVVAMDDDKYELLGWQVSAKIRKILTKIKLSDFLGKKAWVKEPHFNYWFGIEQVNENSYLEGYWQSEKYFLEFQEQIRKDFTFSIPLMEKNVQVANQIDQVTAVSLHIRRGDYVNNPKTTATHGVCSLEYYQKAIQYIVDRVDSPCFFIFSDDIKWAKENLNLTFPCQYIDHNQGGESYNDMRLMSLCQHHIIANSSFSWWGAWLNSNSDKVVVAPKQWFANDVMNVKDLLPKKWITL
jgi:hypothetical protein